MKRILSLVLALTMLLGCSLMVFAKEPCEFCEDGEVYEDGKHAITADELPDDFIRPASDTCSICDTTCEMKWAMNSYTCRNCGELAYARIYVDYVCETHGVVNSDSWNYLP